ncbi:MAG: hypothetical protein IJ165_03445 [Proteobacteria bacterium]|nr:hypothetical protein [Pseudomonadota bacterium]
MSHLKEIESEFDKKLEALYAKLKSDKQNLEAKEAISSLKNSLSKNDTKNVLAHTEQSAVGTEISNKQNISNTKRGLSASMNTLKNKIITPTPPATNIKQLGLKSESSEDISSKGKINALKEENKRLLGLLAMKNAEFEKVKKELTLLKQLDENDLTASLKLYNENDGLRKDLDNLQNEHNSLQDSNIQLKKQIADLETELNGEIISIIIPKNYKLGIYKGPGYSYEQIGSYSKISKVKFKHILDAQNGWYKINLN